MAKTKKVGKYEVATEYPQDAGDAWKMLTKSNKTFDELLALTIHIPPRNWGGQWVDSGNGDRNWVENTCAADFYRHRVTVEGMVDPQNWQGIVWKDTTAGTYWLKRFLNAVWPYTEECAAINAAFLQEYDSREDLQEMYRDSAQSSNYFNGLEIQTSTYYEGGIAAIEKGGYRERPADYAMFHHFYDTHTNRKRREVAREPLFQEGDLVVLRLPYVDHPDWDPMWVSRYVQARDNVKTPDKTVERIGMLTSITDKVGSYRGAKGSRLMKVLWFGKEDAVMVQEKVIKFHERPKKSKK